MKILALPRSIGGRTFRVQDHVVSTGNVFSARIANAVRVCDLLPAARDVAPDARERDLGPCDPDLDRVE